MIIVVVYEKGHDMPHKIGDYPVRHADLIDDHSDVLLVWRHVTDPDDPTGGSLQYEVVSTGAWENLSFKDIIRAVRQLEEAGLGDD